MVKIYPLHTAIIVHANSNTFILSPSDMVLIVKGDLIILYDHLFNNAVFTESYSNLTNQNDEHFSTLELCLTYLNDFIHE